MKKSINELLGAEAEYLLNYKAVFPKEELTIPSSDFVDRVFLNSDRNMNVVKNLNYIYNTGRLAGTGYLSILPVDQPVEHGAAVSFAANPIYFNPDKIVELAIESGSNALVSTLGVLGITSRKYAHKIPMIVKLNHNEVMTYPIKYDQIMFADVEQAYNLGAMGIAATVYFGAENSSRQIIEVSQAFKHAHELGMCTILWTYLRNPAYNADKNYHVAADLTSQGNHLGATIEADIIKQKQPENNGGFRTLPNYGKSNDKMYNELCSEHPIDMVRYQVIHNYMGKIGIINSGGESLGANDYQAAARTAVINKRGGGQGLICGRKAFQRPMQEGIELLNMIQDIYLDKEITIA